MRLGTANGGFNIRIEDIEVGVGGTRFPGVIGFSDSYAAAFNILGRENFFHRFSICFNEIMRTVVLVPLGR